MCGAEAFPRQPPLTPQSRLEIEMPAENPTIPIGLCQCGCGLTTKVSPATSSKYGYVRGVPRRYLRGHVPTKVRPDLGGAAPFKIGGVYCRLIPLTRGLYAIVNANDYAWLSHWNWYALKGCHTFYAVTNGTKKNGDRKRSFTYMHRLIAGDPDNMTVDHRNGNGLHNTRENIRVATVSQNNCNRHRSMRTNTSGLIGVIKFNARLWRADLQINGERVNIGYFRSSEEAAHARDAAALKHHGEFATLNFPK